MAIATGTAILGAGLLGAGASMYGANKAASAANGAQRNIGSELNTILGQVPQFNQAGLANQRDNAAAYNRLANQNLDQGLFGGYNFDARAALAAKSPEELASIEAEAAKYGQTPEEWLTGHTLEQIQLGNAPALQDFQRFGTRSSGLVDTLGALQGYQDYANARSSSYQRGANLADMESLAPRADALRRQLNPELFASLDRIDGTAGSYTAGDGLDRSALQRELEAQALADLQRGGALSPEEQRIAQQQARGASMAAGLGGQTSALAAEVLNLDSARRARLDQARNFAGAVDASGFSQRATAEQSRQNINNSNFGQRLGAANLRGSFLFDPSSVLGTVDNRLNSTTTLGMAQGQFTGAPDYTGALLNYGNAVFDNNSNARAASGIAQANAYGALGGGLLSAAGSLGGAYLMSRPTTPAAPTPGLLF